MIELDGAAGEGGGQILRSSLALSLMTGRAFHLRNIRAKRRNPGLRPQHLLCARAATAIGRGYMRGDSQGSSDLVFEPGVVLPGKYHFAVGTAGATALVAQTLYLPLALRADAPSEVVVSGGTHVKAAPCYHFLETTWRAYMEMFGLHLKLHMIRPGFFPRGGGAIRIQIEPSSHLDGFRLKEKPYSEARQAVNGGRRAGGARTKSTITGISAVAGLPEHIAQRQAHRAAQKIKAFDRKLKIKIDEEKWQGGPGTVLTLVLDTQPVPALFFALGERGKKAERVADEAVEQAVAFMEHEPVAVDPHSADQIVLPLALAEGGSSFAVSEITQHLLTNVTVIRKFVERNIVCEGEVGRPGRVMIE